MQNQKHNGLVFENSKKIQKAIDNMDSSSRDDDMLSKIFGEDFVNVERLRSEKKHKLQVGREALARPIDDDSNGAVTLASLVSSMRDVDELSGKVASASSDLSSLRSLVQSQTRTGKAGTLLDPAEKASIKRDTTKQITSHSMDTWQPIVKKNRETASLSFPLHPPKPTISTIAGLTSNFEPVANLEKDVDSALKEINDSIHSSDVAGEFGTETSAVTKGRKKLAKQEMQENKERTIQMAKLRSQMYLSDLKAKKAKRMKKRGRKKDAKKRRMQELAEFEANNFDEVDSAALVGNGGDGDDGGGDENIPATSSRKDDDFDIMEKNDLIRRTQEEEEEEIDLPVESTTRVFDGEVSMNPFEAAALSRKYGTGKRTMSDTSIGKKDAVDLFTASLKNVEKEEIEERKKKEEERKKLNDQPDDAVGSSDESGSDDDSSDSDSDSDDDENNSDVELTQEELIARAFASDPNMSKDFEDEKKAQLEGDLAPTSEEVTNDLPGWGWWGGEGLSEPKRLVNRKKRAAEKRKERIEKAMSGTASNLIVSATRDKKFARAGMMDSVPHPYNSAEQFEKSMETALGKEWNSMKDFTKSIKAPVIVKKGVAIAPVQMTKGERKKRNLADRKFYGSARKSAKIQQQRR